MLKLSVSSSVLLALLVTQPVAGSIPTIADSYQQAEAGEAYAGGGAYSHLQGRKAFLQPADNLDFSNKLDFKIGESIFAKLWVFSPSSTSASDGLGPLHNARSCMGCHIGGGRGHVPSGNWPQDNAISMLMRLSIAPQNEQQKQLLVAAKVPSIDEPNYGSQLQDFAMQGLLAEGRINIEYTEQIVELNGGQQAVLRHPKYSITDLKYGPLHPSTMTSVRVANPMIGLGLLEAIDEQDLLALEDIDDRDGDGISGKANRVWQHSSQSVEIGRFGWKAGSPSLNQQNSSAFATDMGLSTVLLDNSHQGDCTALQTRCTNAPDGRSTHLAGVEVAPQMSEVLLTFVRNIAVPKRIDIDDPEVLAGKAVFYQTGCTSCHQPKFITKTTADIETEQAGQLIWPYTDLLLHDMGPALADNRPEFAANGSEWRTAPLWGIGKTAAVSAKTEFLHDGRARSLLEAILWHGGEAQEIRDKVVTMKNEQRTQLIKFLESL
ncbi:di-heme oxidoredictase family protein [Gammaproteobacteria bacterium AS21]